MRIGIPPPGTIYTYDFYEPQPYAARMQQEMISEITAAKPEYLVFVKIPTSWDARSTFDRAVGTPVFSWVPKFVQANYDMTGIALVQEDPVYAWGREELKQIPRSDQFVAIFKRKN